jgi:metallo-beta-lactamase class B
MRILGIAAIVLALGITGIARQNEAWTRATAPVHIVGNLYWVGTYDLSSYLITGDEGHILINTGLESSTALIRTSVESLGFRFEDIRLLLATHAHWDHVAALAEIKQLTGARLLMHEGDVPSLEDGGRSDFRFGASPNTYFAPVKVDEALTDGARIRLGSTELTLHHHPGHTKGASSFTFTTRHEGREYRVLIANMGSINPGVRVSGMDTYPQIRQDYARTFASQQALAFDIWVASHASQFGLHEKTARPGGPERFADANGYRREVARLEATYLRQLEEERAAQ